MRIDEDFFKWLDTIEQAKKLLGKVINHKTSNNLLSGIISEVEVYTQDDPRAHTFKWKTKSNSTMFERYGHLYVYFTYGMYYCMNITSENEWFGSGVLIRSIIPYRWVEQMISNRNWKNKPLKWLTNGPAKATIAMEINKKYDWVDLLDKNSNIYLEDIWYKIDKIKTSTRIWISKAKDKLFRFYI